MDREELAWALAGAGAFLMLVAAVGGCVVVNL